MKKVLSLLLAGCALVMPSLVEARNVGEAEAKAAAAYFMTCYSEQTDLTADDVTLVYQIDNPTLAIPACYFFNVGKDGWVIVSGSTATDAVLGYSDEGQLEAECLPQNMLWYVGELAQIVMAMQEVELESEAPIVDEWTAIFNHTLKRSTKDTRRVLMAESYDQGPSENPTYNMLCPNVNGQYCPTGCVATALTQICHYYRFPINPRGRTSYSWNGETLAMKFDTVFFDYSKMPNRITASSTDEQKLEIAKLSYSLGIAVHMQYSPEGSGAYSNTVPSAMSNYFRYQRGTMVYRSNVSEEFYMDRVRSELEMNRLIYMGGASSTDGGRDAAGHAWVCGGYEVENTNRYYMNWGWGGSGNGFYNLRSNYMPVSGYNFNLSQEIVYGIIPPSADSTAVDFMGVEGIEPGARLGEAYPNPATYSVTLPYDLNSAAELVVYSVDGAVVERRQLQAGEGKAVVDVRSLPAGLYLYRLNGATGKFIVR